MRNSQCMTICRRKTDRYSPEENKFVKVTPSQHDHNCIARKSVAKDISKFEMWQGEKCGPEGKSGNSITTMSRASCFDSNFWMLRCFGRAIAAVSSVELRSQSGHGGTEK